jgi:hypothetical protein
VVLELYLIEITKALVRIAVWSAMRMLREKTFGVTVVFKDTSVLFCEEGGLSPLTKSEERSTRRATKSVTAEMLTAKQLHGLYATFILAAVAVISLCASAFGATQGIFIWSLVIAVGYLGAILVDSFLIAYRARHGFFGNTEAEAREIVSYIIDNAEHFGGGGSRTIFDPAERPRVTSPDFSGVVEGT